MLIAHCTNVGDEQHFSTRVLYLIPALLTAPEQTLFIKPNKIMQSLETKFAIRNMMSSLENRNLISGMSIFEYLFLK